MPSKRSDTTESSVRVKKLKRHDSGERNAANSNTTSDPYQESVKWEEREAASREAARDSSLFDTTCRSISSWLTDIDTLKKTGANAANLSQLRHNIALAVLVLKKLNRLDKLRVAAARGRCTDARTDLDQHHLRLQNLLYTLVHLRKEIARCVSYRSRDEQIALVSVEEFLREAPEDIAPPNIAAVGGHQLQLARLNWELEQRGRLTAQCRQLSEQQVAIGRAIESRRDTLHSLAPQLDTVLQSTKSLQRELSVCVDDTRLHTRLSHKLSQPLFAIFLHASSYARTCDTRLSVSVCGDEFEADAFNSRQLQLQQQQQQLPSRTVSSPSKIDLAEEEMAESGRHRYRVSTTDTAASSAAAGTAAAAAADIITQQHPLQVVLETTVTDGVRVRLVFSHLTAVQLVCVLPSVQHHSTTLAGPLFCGDSLLQLLRPVCNHCCSCWLDVSAAHLYTAAKYRLSAAAGGTAAAAGGTAAAAGGGKLQLQQLLSQGQLSGRLGVPYCWCQQLAECEQLAGGGAAAAAAGGGGGGGGEPAMVDGGGAVRTEFSSRGAETGADGVAGVADLRPVPAVLEAVRRRVEARWQLQQTLNSLERGSIVVDSKVAAAASLWPLAAAPAAQLTSWRAVTSEQLGSCVKQLPAGVAAADSCQFHYQAVFALKRIRLTCYISLPVDYPCRAPVFNLVLNRNNNNNSSSSANNNNSNSNMETASTYPIRAVECAVNTDVVTRVRSAAAEGRWRHLLACQLRWLQQAVDILATSAGEHPSSTTTSLDVGGRSAGGDDGGVTRVPALFYDAELRMFVDQMPERN